MHLNSFPSSLFPFPLFLSFSLLVTSVKASWFPESTTHDIWMLPRSQINTYWSQSACWWLVVVWLLTSRSKALIMSWRLYQAWAKEQTELCSPLKTQKIGEAASTLGEYKVPQTQCGTDVRSGHQTKWKSCYIQFENKLEVKRLDLESWDCIVSQ